MCLWRRLKNILLLLLNGHVTDVCSCYTRKVLDQIMIILIFILHVAYAFQPLDVTCLGPLKRKWEKLWNRSWWGQISSIIYAKCGPLNWIKKTLSAVFSQHVFIQEYSSRLSWYFWYQCNYFNLWSICLCTWNGWPCQVWLF